MSKNCFSGCRAVVVLMLAAMCLPGHAWAGIGFQPVNPEELKMTAEPQAPGAQAIILYRQVDRDDNIHTGHEDNYYRIKVLKEEGREYANVEIPFTKGLESIVNLHARTIRPDGTIAEFDGKVYEKIVVKARTEKILVKAFTLPDVQIGSIIEYYYTDDFAERWIINSHWILSEALFTRNARFSLKPFVGDFDNPYHLRWTYHSLPAGADPKQNDADHIVRMEAHNIPAFQSEDYMPPEDEMKARVDFIYSDEDFISDADKFWQKFGKKRYGALESFVGKPKDVQDAVAQLVAPSDTPEQKLRKIYDRVQQIRNTSFEARKTEQEEKRDKEKSPANAGEVLKKGYGDGQQLTWLFLAMARAAGFEAYGCWVAGRDQYFFNPKLMQKDRLDGNVVLVKVNGKDMYFDPGAAFTPFGMLAWAETNVPGMKMEKDSMAWIQTTLPESKESEISRSAKLKLSDTGDLEGKLTVTYTGLEAMYRRQEERSSDEVARKKLLEDQIKEQIPAAADVDLANKPDWSSTNNPLVAEFNLKIPGWVSSAGKRAILPVGLFINSEKHIFEHASRVQPIYFRYPYEKFDDVTIELPAGWQISSVPPGEDKDAHVIGYTLKVEKGADTVHITRKLNVDFIILDPKYYTALRSFFQMVRTGDEEQVILQPGTASASN